MYNCTRYNLAFQVISSPKRKIMCVKMLNRSFLTLHFYRESDCGNSIYKSCNPSIKYSSIAHVHFKWVSTVRYIYYINGISKVSENLIRALLTLKIACLIHIKLPISNADLVLCFWTKCQIKCTFTMLFILIWVFCFLNACVQTMYDFNEYVNFYVNRYQQCRCYFIK